MFVGSVWLKEALKNYQCQVVEEPYTMREARIHVRHVRDLLKAVDPIDAYNGVDCASLSFLNTVCNGDIMEKKRARPDPVDCTPPDYVLPATTGAVAVREVPILPLHPATRDQPAKYQCIKVLTPSGWNPPPGHRKLHGDLLYLQVNENRLC